MKRAALLFASGTEEIEALTPVDILRRAGAHVDIIGVGRDEPTGSHGIRIKTDMTLASADLLSYDMIIIPGGMPGTTNIEETGIAEVLRKADAEGKIIAAICAAPMIIGRAGLLAGREAICYPGFEKYLSGFRGTVVGIAYRDFILPNVPHGRFDVAVDVLISEGGIYAKS